MIRKFKAECIEGGYPKPPENEEDQEAKDIGNVLNNPQTITLSLFSKPLASPSKVANAFLKQTEGLNFNKQDLNKVQNELTRIVAENDKLTKPKVRVKKEDNKPAKKKEEPKPVEKPPVPKALAALTELRKSMGAHSLEL